MLWLSKLTLVGLFGLLSAGVHLTMPSTPPVALELWTLGIVGLVAFTVSYASCYFILRYQHLHGHLSNDHNLVGVQKIHASAVPRVGGFAILVGLLLSLGTLSFALPVPGTLHLALMLLSALPVFMAGFVEDITKRVSIGQRFLSAFISAGLAALLLQAIVPNIGVPWLDPYLAWGPWMLLLTIVGVAGVAHSFNLIDGMNGLAAGFATIILSALFAVAYLVGDGVAMLLGLCILMATLAFLLWNWPRGLIFLGDGGAYMLGFLCATLSILLIVRHPEVSPWLPLVLMGYPVFETLFSIFRRILIHRVRHDRPDDRHLHQLTYQLIRGERPAHARSWISCNSLTALQIWMPVSFMALLAVHWYDDTEALVTLFLGGVIFYIVLYQLLYFALFRLQLSRK